MKLQALWRVMRCGVLGLVLCSTLLFVCLILYRYIQHYWLCLGHFSADTLISKGLLKKCGQD